MHIVIDIRLLASGKVSGIEEYTRHLVNNILELDKDNSYSLFYNSMRRSLGDFGLDLDKATLRRFHYPNKLFDASIRFFSRPRIDKMVPADVIFSPHFNILAHTSSTLRVMTVHDLSFVHHPEFFSARKRFWHWLQNYKKQIKKADHIIAVSDATKNDLMNVFQVPEEKITRIYSGLDPSLHRLKSDDEQLLKYKKEHRLNRPFFLFLAALEPRKNAIAVLRAFDALKKDASFRDYELVLAGAKGWLYDDIFRLVKNMNSQDDIRFLGEIASHERVYLYNLASCFLYPSFFEGFGLPPLEAQVCEAPVIASNRSSLPEILGNSAVLVDPWRIEDIVLAMQEIVKNNSFKNLLVERGRDNVKRFSWKNAAEQTIDVLENSSGV